MAGVSVDTYNLTQAQLRSVIEDSARDGGSPIATKIGGLYASFMDEARVNKLDDAPLQRDLARLKAIRTKAQMAEQMGATTFGYGASLIGFGVIPDLKGPKVYTAAIGPGGLGLPNRDYYLEGKFKPQRDAYAAHLARTLELARWPNARAAAQAVLAFETRIAEATWPLQEQRDPNKIYKPMTAAQLRAFAPGFEWADYFRGLGNPRFGKVIVTQDTAVAKAARIYAETPLDTLKAWQAFHTTTSASSVLSQRFIDNQFAFSKAISGQQQIRPRWNRGVNTVDAILGEALGQVYVERHFPASSKARMEELVGNLQKAMRARIQNADWMSPQTKAEAFSKLDAQRVKVGYPDKWRDYSNLRIDRNDLYGNVKRAKTFMSKFNMDRLGQPMDREEWGMTPQTLNAYFSPLGNEIVFPAAFLQAPMFDPKADPAVNYGAIGAVIGHEITHGFDDQGRQFDGKGELRNWWTDEDGARFTGEAAKLAEQYSGYEELPGLKVNGKLTLGENIGDQGGVLLAYDAYKASLGGKAAPIIDGYSGDQRFFLAWAQGWQKKVREDAAKMTLVTDVHSPARWRVDGTLRNIDAWYAAFDVKPGDKLYLKPQDRVRVW
jgi:putative endopeptidase